MNRQKPLTTIFTNFGNADYGLSTCLLFGVLISDFPWFLGVSELKFPALCKSIRKWDSLIVFLLFQTCYSKHMKSK